MKYAFPAGYGEKCILIPVDAVLIPLVAGALRPFEQRYSWLSDADYEAGYNAFAELQAAMANNCFEEMIAAFGRLQMEVRALRGVDELDPNYNDPLADPFTLQMANVEELKAAFATLQTSVDAIKLLLEGMQNAETLEDIKSSAAQIALLLA